MGVTNYLQVWYGNFYQAEPLWRFSLTRIIHSQRLSLRIVCSTSFQHLDFTKCLELSGATLEDERRVHLQPSTILERKMI